MILRKRQKLFVDRSIKALHKHGNTLGVASVGFGKTIAMSAVIGKYCQSDDVKACVLAHRDELVSQNRDKFKRVVPGVTTSVFQADEKSWSGQAVFAMVQTMSRPANLKTIPKLDLLVIDEAHHAVASTYRRVIARVQEQNPSVAIYGVTATAGRGDRKGLRPVFSNVADQVRLGELIRSGHLVKPRTFVIDIGTQEALQNVRKTVDDFDMSAVADIMDKHVINDEVVKQWQKLASDCKTIVFCSTVEHANHVHKSFLDSGVSAAVIHGDLSKTERKALLQDFDRGSLQVLLNCFVLTEGFDSQPTGCIVLLRPSSHKSTLIQMVGRGLRTVDPYEYPGVLKTDCIVLDFGTSSLLHGTLEQDVNLDGKEFQGEAPTKECPECDATVPLAIQECPLCGYVWQPEVSAEAVVPLNNFIMSEVDLLAKSSFVWCDIFGDNAALVANGFNAWGGVFFLNGRWHGIGGAKGHKTRLISISDRTICLATADDWLNENESDESAHKTRRWLSQPATERQLQYLPVEYRHDHNLTRYQASALLTFRFNKSAIQKLIFDADRLAMQEVA